MLQWSLGHASQVSLSERLERSVGLAIRQGFVIDRNTLYSLLQSCVQQKDISAARQLHSFMICEGLDSLSVLGDHLIRLFALCGALHEANMVFCTISKPTIYTWSAIIIAHTSLGECESVLDLYKRMRQDGEEPSDFVFMSVLQACSDAGTLEQGMLIHDHIARTGLESEVNIGSMLVKIYASCGRLAEANRVFDNLSSQDVVSWSTMIAGYTQQGQGLQALELFEKMQKDCILPDKVSYSCVLKACGSIEAFERGKLVHNQMILSGIQVDVVLGNTLIDMYTKCGNLLDAHQVFDDLVDRNVISWSTLIGAYVRFELNSSALELFTKMLCTRVNPGKVAFVSILKACVGIGKFQNGRMVHDLIIGMGFEVDVEVCSALIDMYAKFGSLREAHSLLKGSQKKNVFSWNALISGYDRVGLGQLALELYEKMCQEGTKPDNATFSCILKACANVGATTGGRIVHDHMIRNGYQLDIIVGNTLVDMYAKLGALDMARKVFDCLPKKDSGTWGAMITGYAWQGHGCVAFNLFEKMLWGGISPDSSTFLGVLKACGILGAVEQGKLIHDLVIRSRLEKDELISNSLVDMYFKCCYMTEAHSTFQRSFKHDVVSWNVMIVGHVQHENFLTAFEFFRKMQQEGIKPDRVTFSNILKACSSLGGMTEGNLFHSHVIKSGFQSSTVVGSTLVDMYAKCGNLKDAHEIFDQMPNRGVFAWSALIAGYILHNDGYNAFNLYLKMQSQGIHPDKVIYMYALRACSLMGAWSHGKHVHVQILRSGLESDVAIGNMLVDLYAKSGDIKDAKKLFDNLLFQNIVACNAICAGYAQQGNWRQAKQCLHDMEKRGWEPLDEMYTNVLAACSHVGNVEEGHQSFKEILKKNTGAPNTEHIISMVDLLGRAGCFNEALKMVQSAPGLSDVGWMSLLSSCRIYGQIELGRLCFDQIVSINPGISASYTIMSNIYADAQRWEEMHEVQELRKCAGAWKLPGRAWVEANSNVHEFLVEDNLHSDCNKVYAFLARIQKPLKNEGYVPQLDQTVRLWTYQVGTV